MKLYIGNLAWAATEKDLELFFEPFGVKKGTGRVIRDRETGRSKGYGFIEVEKGDDAINEMNGKELLGRPARINVANQQTSNAPRRT
jgi:RNA recognition motif-containing protein